MLRPDPCGNRLEICRRTAPVRLKSQTLCAPARKGAHLPLAPPSARLPGMSAPATTYKFTVDEYMRLYENGLFGEDDRIELLRSFRERQGAFASTSVLKPP